MEERQTIIKLEIVALSKRDWKESQGVSKYSFIYRQMVLRNWKELWQEEPRRIQSHNWIWGQVSES